MAGMHLTTEMRGAWHIIAVKGRIDSLTADELTASLRAAVAAHSQVAIDCSGVDYISSAGLTTFMEGSRAARAAHSEIRLCAPSTRVKQVLDLSKLRDLLNVHETLPC